MGNATRFWTVSICAVLISACSKPFHASNLLSTGGTALTASIVVSNPDTEQPSRGPVTLSGTCANGLSVDISGDIQAPMSAVCSEGKFSVEVELSDGEGLKSVRISQTGTKGGESSAIRVFRRDNTAPALALITPAANLNVRGTVVVQGSCETGLEVQIAEGTASYRVPCANAMFATTLTLVSADGRVNLMIAQTDAAGNKSETPVAITKDTAAPVVTITAPAAASIVTSQGAIQGACETGVPVTVSGAGVAAPVTGACANAAYNVTVVYTNGAGSKAVQVSQTDEAGNTGSATRSFTREADIAPQIAIAQPAANTVFQNTLTVSGTCQTGLTINFSGTGWMAPATATCANGAFSAAITFTAGDGSKNLIASQTSAQGLTGSASRTFVRDTTAPAVTIAAPAANSLVRTTVAISGACETGLPVQIAGAGAAAAGNVTCANGAYSSTVTLSAGEGSKTITVTQTDSVGNAGSSSRAFTRDSIAPAVTITAPAADSSFESGATITGTCESTLQVVASGTGLSASSAVACAASAYSLNVSFSAGDGAKAVTISQTDAAGNVGSVSRNFVRAAPMLTGAQLYAQHCAGCHGALASSSKTNRTADQISAGITLVPSMNSLSFLTVAQRQAIASALTVAVDQPAFACNANQTLEQRSIAKNVKRLSRRQYLNTVNSLLGRAFSASAAQTMVNTAMANITLPADDDSVFSRFDGAVAQQHMKGYFDLADVLAGTLTNATNYSTFVTAFINLDRGTCTTVNAAALSSDCAQRFINNFGRRALRRPLVNSTEVNEPSVYMTTYNAAGGNAAGINAVVFRFLLAPNFLYQVENDGALVSGSLYKLSSHAVASRLSYMFWNTMPDETLLTQAASGDLSTDTAFATALTYVTDHANAQDAVREFMSEWLKLRNVPQFQTNNVSLNYLANGLTLDASLRSAMIEEVQELGSYIYRNNLTFNDLFTSDVSFARDSRLMNIYGVSAAAAATVTPANAVRFPAGQHSGLLTRAALVTGGSELANPIKRGIRIRREILCLPLDNPPADLEDALEPPPVNVNMTTRQRYDNATSAQTCMNCHQYINSLGHGLGNFNSFGKYQTQEPTFAANGAYSGNNLPIDSVVNLATSLGAGLSSSNAGQLSNLVASHRATRVCVSEKALRFAEGRQDDTTKEACRLNGLYGRLSQSASLKDFLRSVAQDQEFRHRLVGN